MCHNIAVVKKNYEKYTKQSEELKMSANVESMFYYNLDENGNRFVPWHGLGTAVDKCLNSAEALTAAGLDWQVVPKPVFDGNGNQIPNYIANTRSLDGTVLGIVTNRYSIVQNQDAFSFTDNLIGDDVKYVTAGSLNNGRKIWLLAQLPKEKILGDDISPYICFTNTHDGTGAVKVCCTPIRVVCNNTLNLALSTATRSWSTRHTGDISSKLFEAERTLELTHEYMKQLNESAEKYCDIKVDEEALMQIVGTLFPYNENSSERTKDTQKQNREKFLTCYVAPDIAQFMGTAWGVINAASDFATHVTPNRMTKKYAENNWNRVLNGHPIIDKVVSAVNHI